MLDDSVIFDERSTLFFQKQEVSPWFAPYCCPCNTSSLHCERRVCKVHNGVKVEEGKNGREKDSNL